MSLESELHRWMAETGGVQEEAGNVKEGTSGTEEEAASIEDGAGSIEEGNGDVGEKNPLPAEKSRRVGDKTIDIKRTTTEQHLKRKARGGAQRIIGVYSAKNEAIEKDIRFNDRVILERFGDTGIRMGDFTDIYRLDKILRDQEFTLDRGTEHELSEPSTVEAKRLEEIFLRGVNVGGLLGGESLKKDGDFSVSARHAAKYDDTSNRLDVVVDVDFREPVESYDGEISTSSITFGIDVTTSSSHEGLFDKLTRHYNSKFPQVPFGFSQFAYYQREKMRNQEEFVQQNEGIHDQEGLTQRNEVIHDQKKLVQRFVIALSPNVVNALWNSATVVPGQNEAVRDFHPQSKLMLETRFKVLAEFRAQNLLRTAMLPDDQDEEPAKSAALQIDAADKCFNAALRDCANEIIGHDGYVPPSIIPKDEEKRVAAIEDYLIQQSDPRVKKSDGIDDLAFINCMKYTRALMNAAYIQPDKEPDPEIARRKAALLQKIDAHRIIGSHNHSFNLSTEEMKLL